MSPSTVVRHDGGAIGATHVQVEVPVVVAGLVRVLLAARTRAADTGSMHPVSA